MKLRTLTALTFITSLILGMASPALALKQIAKYRDWTVYKHQMQNDTMCFAVSAPKDMIPRQVKRRDVLYYVTRWKSSPGKPQVSIKIGYPLKEESKPSIRIKAQSFNLFVSGDKAWIRDQGDEKLLLRSMRRGARMTVTAISAEGVETSDQYSLSGISKALKRVKRLCR